MINACFMLTNPEIFAVFKEDATTKSYAYTKRDFQKFQNSLSGGSTGGEGGESINDTSAGGVIDIFHKRFFLFHQQLYLFVLVVFFLLFFAANSIYLFTFYLVFGLFKWSQSIYIIFKDVISFIYSYQVKSYTYFKAPDSEPTAMEDSMWEDTYTY